MVRRLITLLCGKRGLLFLGLPSMSGDGGSGRSRSLSKSFTSSLGSIVTDTGMRGGVTSSDEGLVKRSARRVPEH